MSEDTGATAPAEGDAESLEDEIEVDGEELSDAELESVLESLLLVVDSPASVEQLAAVTDASPERVAAILTRMAEAFTVRGSGFDLRYAGDGWRLYTRTAHAPYVERLLLDGARTKLTRAALETLAVVAYRQPLTRARISAVRGVNVDGVVRTLLARGLIAEAGTDPETTATQYATTELFLERLGLASLADLPELAPLLPDVDLIDDISDSLEADPRFARMNRAPVTADQVDTDPDD
ncbi:SMC-Scp complex subunit ScpB [Rhodococcus triatomae]|uniref:Segregation and condensation protein B n=1 Tax=Rhodococcus triatomae TaxID=300028 RepID=A0A1G8STJ2_9NOCA|nr:SMC-Scp complex subunit ScpB [Rhodococcus triatomae]QNG25403.1 SMC-Scp complex subunit ScpB [Rhodococcus triatomae]SDJ32557.1 segregation and condensation protein B [Rhodococcus triatomae]